MSNVIDLSLFRNRDTIGVLRHLLERAQRGEIAGVAFSVDDLITGKDVTGYVGSYRRDPGRLARRLADLERRLFALADHEEDLAIRDFDGL